MGDFYTFPALAGLPDYSIEGQLFGGVKAKINYASTPWEVFKQNGLNYNLDTDTIESSDAQVNIVGESADNYNWVVTGIPPAFAQLSDKTKISGFQGFIDVVRNYTIVTRWENADI